LKKLGNAAWKMTHSILVTVKEHAVDDFIARFFKPEFCTEIWCKNFFASNEVKEIKFLAR
jgi:hypothetical protein